MLIGAGAQLWGIVQMDGREFFKVSVVGEEIWRKF